MGIYLNVFFFNVGNFNQFSEQKWKLTMKMDKPVIGFKPYNTVEDTKAWSVTSLDYNIPLKC